VLIFLKYLGIQNLTNKLQTTGVTQLRYRLIILSSGICLSLILTQACFGQFKVVRLVKESVPKNVKYIGNIINAIRWTDNIGDNVVILTKHKKKSNDGYIDHALYAYHYLISSDSSKLTWKVYDNISDCDVDVFLYFLEKSFAVTDLNKDGKAEIWIMYKVSCQGDISPVPMKIIMYQDKKKFALRGTTKVGVSTNEYMGGDFSFDDAFKTAPIEFRKYAEKLWNLHKVETWNQ